MNVAPMPVVLDARVVTGTGGGPDKTILNSPRFLARNGYRMLCAYMHPPDDPGFAVLRARAEELEATLLPIPDRGAWDASVVPRLLEICRRERVAIWHGHDYKSNLIGLLLRPFWPMRLVTTVHGWIGQRVRVYEAIDRRLLRFHERVFCVSEALVDECRSAGLPEGRCVLLDNGIDTERHVGRSTPEQAKARLGVGPGRRVIGAVGRLSPEKGFDVLIRAVDRLLRDGRDLELLIAGGGQEEAALRLQVEALGRQDRIRLLGFLPDARDLYEAADAFALSSYREGLPNVVLEAMAMEVPVVATRVGGVPRLVLHGESGLLVDPGSEEELACGLASVLDDRAYAERLARMGRASVVAGFSFEQRMSRLTAIYDDLLGRSGVGSPAAEAIPA